MENTTESFLCLFKGHSENTDEKTLKEGLEKATVADLLFLELSLLDKLNDHASIHGLAKLYNFPVTDKSLPGYIIEAPNKSAVLSTIIKYERVVAWFNEKMRFYKNPNRYFRDYH